MPESFKLQMADDGPQAGRRVTLPIQTKHREARRETAKVMRILEKGADMEHRMRSPSPQLNMKNSSTGKGEHPVSHATKD